MQENVFGDITSDSLRGYVVWEPIMRTDDVRFARKATTLLDDPRVHHYWVGSQSVGELFERPLGLKDAVAWDVYLVYPPGVEWKGPRPPDPVFYMHQLPRLPAARRLDATTLADRIRATLGDAARH